MNSETAFLIGVGFLFVTSGLSRFLGERNFKILSTEQKVKLVDQFSLHRSLGTYIPIGIMAAVIMAGRLRPELFRWLFPVGASAVLIFALVLQLSIFRRLRDLELPDVFVSKFRFHSIAVQVGNIVAISLIAYGIMGMI